MKSIKLVSEIFVRSTFVSGPAVDEKILAVDTKVTDVDTRVTDLDTRVTGLDTTVASTKTKVDTIDTTVSGLGTRVTSAETQIGTINTTVTALDTKVTEVEEKADGLDEKVEEVKKAISAPPVPEPLLMAASGYYDMTPFENIIAVYVTVTDPDGGVLINTAFHGAADMDELVTELNNIEDMSDCMVFTHDGFRLIATSAFGGVFGNGFKFSLQSTQPPHPEAEITLTGGGELVPVLKHQHVYLATVLDSLDLSALTVEQYGTAELWLDYTAGSLTWPAALWWVEGDAPTLEAGKSYAVALRNDGVKLRANVQYEDTTPAQA